MILKNANNTCCKEIEIFCPCFGDELKPIVNFLYSGTICLSELKDVAQILDNLTKMFGFEEDLFSVEDQSILDKNGIQNNIF